MDNLKPQGDRVYNFNPGPAVLPEEVLERIKGEYRNYKGTGTSILEISHRSDEFEALMKSCQTRVRQLLGVPDDYHVLYLPGGASLQFSMLPMNIARGYGPVQVINSGRWSGKVITELEIQDIDFEVPASSEDTGLDRVPQWDESMLNRDSSYVHICSNETVGGVQWHEYPETGDVPLVADMASDIMSREFDVEQFGCFYAGVQKNMGPAGVALVVIHDDLVQRTPDDVPTMLDYNAHIKKNSIYNTAPIFPIFVVDMVLEWIQDNGGVSEMERLSKKKSGMVYDLIDSTDFYTGAAQKDSRSRMNVTFRLPSEELEEQFIEEAENEDMIGLAGHRSVGGVRASLYNSLPVEAVEFLVEFMRDFEQRNG